MKSSLLARLARCAVCFVVGVVPLLLLPACNRSNPGGGSAKPRVALIMKSLANEFFLTMADGAKKPQAAHAADYELIVNGRRGSQANWCRRTAAGRRWKPKACRGPSK